MSDRKFQTGIVEYHKPIGSNAPAPTAIAPKSPMELDAEGGSGFTSTAESEGLSGDIDQTRAQPFVGARPITVTLPNGTSQIGNPLGRIPSDVIPGLPSAAVHVYRSAADLAQTTGQIIQVSTTGACTVTLWVV